MNPARDEYLTVPEVAALCRVDESTCYGWRRRKQGPPSLRFVGRVVYRRSDVEAWIAAQIEGSAS